MTERPARTALAATVPLLLITAAVSSAQPTARAGLVPVEGARWILEGLAPPRERVCLQQGVYILAARVDVGGAGFLRVDREVLREADTEPLLVFEWGFDRLPDDAPRWAWTAIDVRGRQTCFVLAGVGLAGGLRAEVYEVRVTVDW